MAHDSDNKSHNVCKRYTQHHPKQITKIAPLFKHPKQRVRDKKQGGNNGKYQLYFANVVRHTGNNVVLLDGLFNVRQRFRLHVFTLCFVTENHC